MAAGTLSLRALRARPVNVPLKLPLVTAGGAVSAAPLVLIDLETEQGVTGRSYVFVYTTLALRPVAQLVTGLTDFLRGDTVAPLEIDAKLQNRFRLLGPQGLTGIAMAGIDMAAWDALAQASGLPLVTFLGGVPKPIQAYNSNGLGLIGEDRAREQARILAHGFGAIKARLGYRDIAQDLAVVRAARVAGTRLMVDYNQCLSPVEAMNRVRRLDEEDLEWIEEPVRADDYEGCARVSAAASTPVQIGENCWGPHDLAKAIAARASDLLMPDAVKIGGVTGWLRAAALAEAHSIPVSSHLYPEISAHLLAMSPTAHWLEYVDWAEPILREPVRIQDGNVKAMDTPGTGIEWDEPAVERFGLK